MSSTGATARLRFTGITHTALLTDTAATETITGLTSFTPRSNNVILDITYEVDPGAATPMALFTRRTADKRKLLGTSTALLPSFTGNQRAGFPIGLMSGFFQVTEQQIAGTPGASDPFALTLARPLDV
jgi:hypothetical protein